MNVLFPTQESDWGVEKGKKEHLFHFSNQKNR